MTRLARFLIRVSSFLGKEMVEILRQPQLILTLVLGPFLILLLFGLGFRNEPRALRTLFVAQEGNELGQQIEAYASSLGPQLIFMGLTDDEAEAKLRLLRGEVDVVAVVPPDAYETVRNSEQAVFTLYHREIDPFQVDYVRVFGQVYVDEVNRRVLRTLTEQGQQEASTIQDILSEAHTSAASLREALARGDTATARQEQQKLKQDLDAVTLAVGATAGLLNGVQETLGPEDQGDENLSDILVSLTDIQEDTDSLGNIEDDQPDYEAEIEQITETEAQLADLEAKLNEFQQIEASVLISPFRSEIQSIAPTQPKPSDFFAPAVIVLLLQHLAVTFASLSIVRERWIGTMELFRVSPISAGETLVSKYLSYLFFGAVLATILTLLVVYLLQVPMLGPWLSYALVIMALLFTSLGIGFVISLVSQTDSQAVQYSMIVLLTSVFFSGAFLSIQTLWEPIRTVSWALPATYGILLLQDIMLRGSLANQILLTALTTIGVGLLILAWILLRRMMARA